MSNSCSSVLNICADSAYDKISQLVAKGLKVAPACRQVAEEFNKENPGAKVTAESLRKMYQRTNQKANGGPKIRVKKNNTTRVSPVAKLKARVVELEQALLEQSKKTHSQPGGKNVEIEKLQNKIVELEQELKDKTPKKPIGLASSQVDSLLTKIKKLVKEKTALYDEVEALKEQVSKNRAIIPIITEEELEKLKAELAKANYELKEALVFNERLVKTSVIDNKDLRRTTKDLDICRAAALKLRAENEKLALTNINNQKLINDYKEVVNYLLKGYNSQEKQYNLRNYIMEHWFQK